MGLFSFFSRKKKTPGQGSSSQALNNVATEPTKEKSWHHQLSELAVVTHPLGNSPGTELERDLLFSFIYSLSHSISELNNEVQDLSSKFYALAEAISAKAAAEGVAEQKFDVVGLTYESSLGYSARISALGKKFTVLFGEPSAVARASTPFHSDISTIASKSVGTENASRSQYVLTVDGIAYVALTLTSELR